MTASNQSRATNGDDQSSRATRVGLARTEGCERADADALPAGALIRLAGALDTTVANRIRRIPVRGSSALHPVLDHLREDECLELVAAGDSGRLGFELAGRLAVMSVTYTLHDRRLIIRTGATTSIARYGDGPVAFEADGIDEAEREGWSVLVSGWSSVQRWGGLMDGDNEVLVLVEPEHVSGRRIRTW
ncbi:pyridoxamine 5'-phosphate oxidase family protein [Kribbella sp. NPDC049174]|uniref:pyridoxamine 5'-phosphate oxidase family protein n=1 Tax=Kribbella sp. NPDC049174 TaxID=3364112 RepID=UPI0037234CBC